GKVGGMVGGRVGGGRVGGMVGSMQGSPQDRGQSIQRGNTRQNRRSETMKSKTEFIERWKLQMVGLAMYGVTSERNDGLMSRSARILELPKEVQGLLGAMYDSLDPENYPCVSAGKFEM